MIHVGVDGNEANVANRVGSNHYAYGLLTAIHDLEAPDFTFTVYLKSPPLPDLPKANRRWRYKVIPPVFAWTQWRLPLSLVNPFHRPRIFFSPGHYAPRFAPMPTIVSVMDLAFLKMPNLFLKFKRGTKQLTAWTGYSVRRAARVIAISKHTKQDLVDTYGLNPQKIRVAYPGVHLDHYRPRPPQEIKQVRNKHHISQKYILHLGTLQPRKNIVRLIQAFEKLPPRHKSVQLVLAGQSGWMTEDIEAAINTSPAREKIVRTGYISQADIPALLSGSACLAMVGIYEGFGMPPVEAFASGTVPVVSGNTSLPEVVGEAGILVDPYSVSSIRHGIIAALEEDPAKRRQRIILGQQHIRKFSWEQSAKVVLESIKDELSI